MTVNGEFKIVFQPKDKSKFGGRRRFSVGANRLAEYVGEHNAATAIKKAQYDGLDVTRVRLRVQGIIDFYKK